MTIEIRLATSNDVDGIFHVRTSVLENALNIDELAEIGITPAAITEMIASSPCAWVAIENDAVIGFSMVDFEEASLFAAFVLPAHEGRGVGKMLIQPAEQALFTQHESIWLETGKSTRAAGFYRAMGWANEQDVGGGDIRLEKRRSH